MEMQYTRRWTCEAANGDILLVTCVDSEVVKESQMK